MQDGNTKMVSVAHALSEALGSDSEKYEEAMAKRLALESQESLPPVLGSLGLKDGQFPYITNEGAVYVGTQDHFEWAKRNGATPHVISEELALHYIKLGWELCIDEPLRPSVVEDVKSYCEDNKKAAAINDMRAIDLEDDWLNWEEEDKQPKQRGRGDRRRKDKERTLQRKKQRQRKVIYSSNDEELPVYGYEEDWE